MDYAKLFALYDHPTHWEYPPGFDYEAANARQGGRDWSGLERLREVPEWAINKKTELPIGPVHLPQFVSYRC